MMYICTNILYAEYFKYVVDKGIKTKWKSMDFTNNNAMPYHPIPTSAHALSNTKLFIDIKLRNCCRIICFGMLRQSFFSHFILICTKIEIKVVFHCNSGQTVAFPICYLIGVHGIVLRLWPSIMQCWMMHFDWAPFPSVWLCSVLFYSVASWAFVTSETHENSAIKLTRIVDTSWLESYQWFIIVENRFRNRVQPIIYKRF